MITALLLSTALAGGGGSVLSMPPPVEQVLPGVCMPGFQKSVPAWGQASSNQIREYLTQRLSCDKIGTGKRAEQFLSAILRDGRMNREQVALMQDFLGRQLAELYVTPAAAKAAGGGEVAAVINAAVVLLERMEATPNAEYRMAALQAGFAWSGQLDAAAKMRAMLDKQRRAGGAL